MDLWANMNLSFLGKEVFLMYLMEVKNLYKNFGGIKAITDINMSVKKDEIVGIIGPNGAGKTTFSTY